MSDHTRRTPVMPLLRSARRACCRRGDRGMRLGLARIVEWRRRSDPGPSPRPTPSGPREVRGLHALPRGICLPRSDRAGSRKGVHPQPDPRSRHAIAGVPIRARHLRAPAPQQRAEPATRDRAGNGSTVADLAVHASPWCCRVPRPTTSPPSNQAAYFDVAGFGGPNSPPGAPPVAYLAIPNSINPNSPATKRAATACHWRLQ